MSKFTDQVMKVLEGGDKGKVSKFENTLTKHLEKQIKIRKEQIVELQEEQEEALDKQAETLVTVDTDRIDSLANRKSYVEPYLNTQFEVIAELNELTKNFKRINREIDKYETVLALIKGQKADS